MTLWRISNHTDLKGLGGLHAAGRWHSQGREVVYLAESPAGALLEALVHFDLAPEDVPQAFTLLEVAVEAKVRAEALDEAALPEDWVQDTALTRQLGDEWLIRQRSALLKVPSAVVPKSYNYLFNPKHGDARKARIVSVTQQPYDARLLRRL